MTLYWNQIHLLYLYHCGLGLLWLHAPCNLEKHKETQKCVKKIIQPLIENRLVMRLYLTTLGSVFDFFFGLNFLSLTSWNKILKSILGISIHINIKMSRNIACSMQSYGYWFMINKSKKKTQTNEKFIKQSCFVQDDENGYMY